jgi:hypothetical protein
MRRGASTMRAPDTIFRSLKEKGKKGKKRKEKKRKEKKKKIEENERRRAERGSFENPLQPCSLSPTILHVPSLFSERSGSTVLDPWRGARKVHRGPLHFPVPNILRLEFFERPRACVRCFPKSRGAVQGPEAAAGP